MNINLGTQWEKYITAKIDSGRYLSASEVVREGLRLLQEQETEKQIRLEQLRQELDSGLHQLDRGDYVEMDEAGLHNHLNGVKRRGRKIRTKGDHNGL